MEIKATVDVIIPAYNASRYIGETIQSALNQTYLPNKIIVVDDGSTDNTAELVRSFGSELITLISTDNGGVSRARNVGIRASNAEYVAFLDVDDLWRADKLALQIEALKKSPEAKVVYSGTSLIDDASLDIADTTGVPYIKGDVFEDILFFERPIFGSASSVMVERSTLEKTDLFDESMRFSEDVDLWAHLALFSIFTYTEEPCVKIRVHDASATRIKNWKKDKKVLSQHFYYVNKFAGKYDLPESNLDIQRRRIIRLFFSKNAKLSEYFSFCNKLSLVSPLLFRQMGGNYLVFSWHLFRILWVEALTRIRHRILFTERVKLFFSEGTVFFSNSKAYNKDIEFNRKRR